MKGLWVVWAQVLQLVREQGNVPGLGSVVRWKSKREWTKSCLRLPGLRKDLMGMCGKISSVSRFLTKVLSKSWDIFGASLLVNGVWVRTRGTRSSGVCLREPLKKSVLSLLPALSMAAWISCEGYPLVMKKLEYFAHWFLKSPSSLQRRLILKNCEYGMESRRDLGRCDEYSKYECVAVG